MKKYLKNSFLYILIISLSFAFYILIHLFKLKKIEPYIRFEKKAKTCIFLKMYGHKHIIRASRKLSLLVPKKQRCLISSLVLKFLLNQKGVLSKICIGVKKNEEKLNAHAWIAIDEEIINTGDKVRDYIILKEIV